MALALAHASGVVAAGGADAVLPNIDQNARLSQIEVLLVTCGAEWCCKWPGLCRYDVPPRCDAAHGRQNRIWPTDAAGSTCETRLWQRRLATALVT